MDPIDDSRLRQQERERERCEVCEQPTDGKTCEGCAAPLCRECVAVSLLCSECGTWIADAAPIDEGE